MTTKVGFIPSGQQSAAASSKELPARLACAIGADGVRDLAAPRPQGDRPQQGGTRQITRARNATAACLGGRAWLGKGGAAERAAQIDATPVGSGLGRDVLGRIALVRGRLSWLGIAVAQDPDVASKRVYLVEE